MDNESIAELVRKWLAGVGDVLPVEELLERIKGREQWIANEIGWRDRLNYQQLEMLQKTEADNTDLRRQLAEAEEDEGIIISERDAAENEAADLRRQLVEERRESAELRSLLSDAAHADLDSVADKINSDLIVENADLRRQLAEAQAEPEDTLLVESGLLAELIAEADAGGVEEINLASWLDLRAEVADLRRQLAEAQDSANTAWEAWRVAVVERDDLRRQLEETSDNAAGFVIEAADLRRRVGEQEKEIDDLMKEAIAMAKENGKFRYYIAELERRLPQAQRAEAVKAADVKFCKDYPTLPEVQM